MNVSLKNSSDGKEIETIVRELDGTLNSALYDIGFLKATIGNKLVNEKIGDSYSGHALDVSIRAGIKKGAALCHKILGA